MLSRKLVLLALGAAAWLACVAAGFIGLQRYAAIAGDSGNPEPQMAAFIAEHRRPGRALAIMAVHPRCPCTKASLAELEDLIARSVGGCDAVLLEYLPLDPPADWPRTAPVRMLAGRPVVVVTDRGGRLATTLGARTSGHLVFADRGGIVRFQGGITLARGHRGQSPAQTAILDALKGASNALAAAPVYGCALEPTCSAPLR